MSWSITPCSARGPLRRTSLTLALVAGFALGTPVGHAAVDASPDAQTLMREAERLRAELRQQQDLVLLLRSRLAEAEAAKAWLPWLVLGLGGSGVLAGWLALRGRGSGRAKPPQRSGLLPPREAPDDEASVPSTVISPPGNSVLPSEPAVGGGQVSTHHLPTAVNTAPGSMVLGGAGSLAPAAHGSGVAGPVAPAGKLAERARGTDGASGLGPTAMAGATGTGPGLANSPPAAASIPTLSTTADSPLRPSEVTAAGHPARAVSVEELFDLEQQVDFFLVLGQTESAVDLLVSHIRGTGGNSALPYMKLLEVYRQQGDEESYERTRKRFNQRFNAHAPDWSVNLIAGRSLEDYPEVMGRIQRVWTTPLDALAELEALMFRRSRGELFDLPAFREVLLLHAMAVDSHERSPMSASKVDILLPLGEDSGAGNTAPVPHLVSSFLPAVGVEVAVRDKPALDVANQPPTSERLVLTPKAGGFRPEGGVAAAHPAGTRATGAAPGVNGGASGGFSGGAMGAFSGPMSGAMSGGSAGGSGGAPAGVAGSGASPGVAGPMGLAASGRPASAGPAPAAGPAGLAGWAPPNSAMPGIAAAGQAAQAGEPVRVRTGSAASPIELDLDLSDFAPSPKDYTAPAAFTDLKVLPEFGAGAAGAGPAANEWPAAKPAKPSH